MIRDGGWGLFGRQLELTIRRYFRGRGPEDTGSWLHKKALCCRDHEWLFQGDGTVDHLSTAAVHSKNGLELSKAGTMTVEVVRQRQWGIGVETMRRDAIVGIIMATID